MSDVAEHYTGLENLETMKQAVRYNRFLLRQLLQCSSPNEAVLDFGSGLGSFALALEQKSRLVTCIEPDTKLLAELRASGLPAHSSLRELPEQAFDFAFSLNVLEHIPEDQLALEALFAALRPGGRLFLYVPAFPILYSNMDRRVGHVRRYSRGELRSKLVRAGFRIERASHVDSLGFAASLLYKWLGDKGGGLNPTILWCYDRFIFPLSRLVDVVIRGGLGKNLAVLAQRPVGTPEPR